MPELYFFRRVCFEPNKEHSYVRSTRWVGESGKCHARITLGCSDCYCNLAWIYGFMHDRYRCHSLCKIKSPAGNRTTEQD